MPTSADPLAVLGRLILADRTDLAAVARREGVGPEDAVDCLHDALCTILGRLGRGELTLADDALHAYVATTVRNAARNRRRRHHLARPHVPLEALDETPIDEASSETLIARAEEHVRVQACVATLCDTQRAVVTLRLLEERAGEDVATALGLTRGHVDVLLHRAKHSLRACLVAQPA